MKKTHFSQKPSIVDVDEDIIQPKAIPKKASRIIERTDGSDDDDDDEPMVIDGGKVTGERLGLDNQGKRVAGCEGMMIACVSTNMSTVRSHDGHMMGT